MNEEHVWDATDVAPSFTSSSDPPWTQSNAGASRLNSQDNVWGPLHSEDGSVAAQSTELITSAYNLTLEGVGAVADASHDEDDFGDFDDCIVDNALPPVVDTIKFNGLVDEFLRKALGKEGPAARQDWGDDYGDTLSPLSIDSTRHVWQKLTTVSSRLVKYPRSAIHQEVTSILSAWRSEARSKASWDRPMTIHHKTKESLGADLFGWGVPLSDSDIIHVKQQKRRSNPIQYPVKISRDSLPERSKTSQLGDGRHQDERSPVNSSRRSGSQKPTHEAQDQVQGLSALSPNSLLANANSNVVLSSDDTSRLELQSSGTTGQVPSAEPDIPTLNHGILTEFSQSMPHSMSETDEFGEFEEWIGSEYPDTQAHLNMSSSDHSKADSSMNPDQKTTERARGNTVMSVKHSPINVEIENNMTPVSLNSSNDLKNSRPINDPLGIYDNEPSWPTFSASKPSLGTHNNPGVIAGGHRGADHSVSGMVEHFSLLSETKTELNSSLKIPVNNNKTHLASSIDLLLGSAPVVTTEPSADGNVEISGIFSTNHIPAVSDTANNFSAAPKLSLDTELEEFGDFEEAPQTEGPVEAVLQLPPDTDTTSLDSAVVQEPSNAFDTLDIFESSFPSAKQPSPRSANGVSDEPGFPSSEPNSSISGITHSRSVSMTYKDREERANQETVTRIIGLLPDLRYLSL